jgi:hypothetical protein
LNHVNPSNPNTTFSSADFGRIDPWIPREPAHWS